MSSPRSLARHAAFRAAEVAREFRSDRQLPAVCAPDSRVPLDEAIAEFDIGQLGNLFRAALERLGEMEKTDGHGVEVLVRAIVGHLRSWKPASVTPLVVLPEPDEPVRDPRGGQ